MEQQELTTSEWVVRGGCHKKCHSELCMSVAKKIARKNILGREKDDD
jgi:hypothetical protein